MKQRAKSQLTQVSAARVTAAKSYILQIPPSYRLTDIHCSCLQCSHLHTALHTRSLLPIGLCVYVSQPFLTSSMLIPLLGNPDWINNIFFTPAIATMNQGKKQSIF